MEKTLTFAKYEILYRFVYGIILLRAFTNKIYKILSEGLFQRTGLGAASDISWGAIFRRDGVLGPLCLLCIHILIWLVQSK